MHNLKMDHFCILVVGLMVLYTFTVGQEENECRGNVVEVSETEKLIIPDCLNKSKIENIWKIPLEKLPCFGVCILKEKGLLTEDGKISHEKSLKWIEDHMKDNVTQRLLIDAADRCVTLHGDKVKVEDDPLCLAFMDVGQCVHDAFLEICLGEEVEIEMVTKEETV